ncbi:MAG: ribose-phosphate diphosphokinase, partial [Candidatus Hydrogenedentota bacterium]
VVSPDAGGVERARGFARRLGGLPLAIIDKRRPRPNVAEVFHIIGEVEGRNAIIVDDMIDTAGTLGLVAEALKREGAESVRAVVTHPVLSGPARSRLAESSISEVIVTNTVPLEGGPAADKITQLSVAALLGEAIRRIHFGESVSSLFLE